jgi:Peptidase family M50
VVLICCWVAAIVIHELGHLGAARLLRVPVTAIYLGGPPALVKVRLGGVLLGAGLLPRGRVVHRAAPSAGRQAMIVAAGPLANLVTAAVALSLPLPRTVGWPIALTWAGLGAGSLVPHRGRDGSASDGTALMAIPGRRRSAAHLRQMVAAQGWAERPEAADWLLTEFWRDPQAAGHLLGPLLHALRTQQRTADLLEIHALEYPLAARLGQDGAQLINALEWVILTLPGIDRPTADLAARRLEWAAGQAGPESRPMIEHSLALARIRQGRLTEVEALCANALAAELPAGSRATVLATVAMARHLLGQDGQQPMAEALTLDPAAELVGEARQVLSRPPPGAQPAARADR